MAYFLVSDQKQHSINQLVLLLVHLPTIEAQPRNLKCVSINFQKDNIFASDQMVLNAMIKEVFIFVVDTHH